MDSTGAPGSATCEVIVSDPPESPLAVAGWETPSPGSGTTPSKGHLEGPPFLLPSESSRPHPVGGRQITDTLRLQDRERRRGEVDPGHRKEALAGAGLCCQFQISATYQRVTLSVPPCPEQGGPAPPLPAGPGDEVRDASCPRPVVAPGRFLWCLISLFPWKVGEERGLAFPRRAVIEFPLLLTLQVFKCGKLAYFLLT